MESRPYMKTSNLVNVITGGWLTMSPFIFGNIAPFQSNEFWIGLIVGVVALIRTFRILENVWLSWLSLIAGIWLITSPFVLGYTFNILFWNSMILGFIVTTNAIWNIAAETSASRQSHAKI